jgi:hypothetical protein
VMMNLLGHLGDLDDFGGGSCEVVGRVWWLFFSFWVFSWGIRQMTCWVFVFSMIILWLVGLCFSWFSFVFLSFGSCSLLILHMHHWQFSLASSTHRP